MSTVTTEPTTTHAPEEAQAPLHEDELLTRPRAARGLNGGRRRRFESLAIFLLFGAAYAILGYQLIVVQHVVAFDALDRLARAYLVWHDAPPKLAVIGFDLPPIPTLLLLPVTVIKPLATSLIGLAVSSAAFAAGVMVLLNRLLERFEMSAPLRYPLLLLFGANPLFAYYASNGMPEMMYLFFLTATLSALVSWLMTGATRFLILAALALAVCSLARYEFIVWALPLTLMVAATLARWRAGRSEVEGTAIVFAAPFAYGLALWALFNGLIVGAPFDWIAERGGSLAINSEQVAQGAGASLELVLSRLAEIVSGTAPLALFVLPLLMLIAFSRRDEASMWLAGLVALAMLVVGADALLADRIGVLLLRDGLTVSVTAFIGAAWIYRSSNGARLPVWLVMMALVGATLPLAWERMQTYPFQNQEQAFVRALESGDDQEGTSSIGGFNVGIAPELRMASFINRSVSAEHEILTDNARSYAVILLSGRPQLFFDRVQRGDDTWNSVRERPHGRVSYMLIASEAEQDLLRQRYPNAAAGTDPGFPAFYRTSRYVLVRVPPQPVTLAVTP